MSDFRIKFTLQGGTGLFTSPPFDSLELALKRAVDLERRGKATIERIVGSEGYFFLDREGCAMFSLPAAGSSNTRGTPRHGRGTDTTRRSRVSGRPDLFGERSVLCLAEEIETPGEGRIRALITVAGTSTGNALLLAAIALGLSWVLGHAVYLFELLRWAGVAYLIWLDVRAWRSAGRPLPPSSGNQVHFWRGLLVALSNPKALAFFTAFLPQFVDPARAAAPSATTAIGNPTKNSATAVPVTIRLFTSRAVCRRPLGTRSFSPFVSARGSPPAVFVFNAVR